MVYVSATDATDRSGHIVGGSDAFAQTSFALDKVEASLKALGSTFEDVTRTRLLVRHPRDHDSVLQAHGLRFRSLGLRPACTIQALTVASMENMKEEAVSLVEVEVDAEVNTS